ncbi:hypothetical protein [Streptomyces sp. NPDC001719]
MSGLEDFPGAVFHSARWNHDTDLSGRRVAVVGNGASTVQFLPEIQPLASRVDVFQSTPHWVLPRPSAPGAYAPTSGNSPSASATCGATWSTRGPRRTWKPWTRYGKTSSTASTRTTIPTPTSPPSASAYEPLTAVLRARGGAAAY